MSTKLQLQKRWKVEPGKSIRERILAKVIPHTPESVPNASVLFDLLDNLPYRHEVPNGRDFRGSDCVDGRELDFSGTDFSYATDVGTFYYCDLSRCKFDESRKDSGQISSCILREASFRKVRFRSTSFMQSDARTACFDEAWLQNTRFDEADLRGASFRGANLKGSCFAGAKLQGCDFRGANLEECSLSRLEVDATTDFRGANLRNAYLDDHYDRAGNLVGRGLDMNTIRIDATTKLGEDPRREAVHLIAATLAVLSDRQEVEAVTLRQAFVRARHDMQETYYEDWYDRMRSGFTSSEIELCDEVVANAYRSML